MEHLLSPALGRQREANLGEFEISLVYRESSRRARVDTLINTVSKNKTNKQTKPNNNKKI